MDKYEKILIALSLILVFSISFAGNHGPCKIIEVNQSDSFPKYLLLKMGCAGTNLATTCSDIQQDVVTFDATTDVGKLRASIVLTAFAAGKDVRVSTWGACPAKIPNVPLVYGLSVK